MRTELITLERAQKLDLLVHLTTELNQSLVLCGPNGIGKSTYLSVLQEKRTASWIPLLIEATETLSFEDVYDQLEQALAEHVAEYAVRSVEQLFPFFIKNGQCVVLFIDEAGHTQPGLITSLIHYAARYNCLKVVFALTREELNQKNKTDRVIEVCHSIDIPPLSPMQCGEYLRYLLANTSERGANMLVDDAMVAKLYQKTLGVPGKIVEELPRLMGGGIDAQLNFGGNWRYYALVGTALVALLWSIFPKHQEEPAKEEPVVEQSPEVVAEKALEPLAIPGQTAPEPIPEAAAPAPGNDSRGVALTDAQKAALAPPQNAANYSGFARVPEKDALEEFPTKKQSANAHLKANEQLKVEIIQPESNKPTTPRPEEKTPEIKPEIITDVAENVSKVDTAAKKLLEATPATKKLKESIAAKKLKESIAAKKLQESIAQAKADSNKLDAKLIAKPNPSTKVVVKADTEASKIVATKPATKITSKPTATEVKKSANVSNKNVVTAKKRSEAPEPKVVSAPKKVTETPIEDEVEVSLDDAGVVVDDAKIAKARLESPGMAKLGVVMPYRATLENTEDNEQLTSTVKKNAIDTGSAKKSASVAKGGTYALQVMTFSQPELLKNFMARHKSMGANLRTLTTNKDGIEHFIVVYGSYPSAEKANAARAKLPSEFKKAFARKL